jgi:hypothetical protein
MKMMTDKSKKNRNGLAKRYIHAKELECKSQYNLKVEEEEQEKWKQKIGIEHDTFCF